MLTALMQAIATMEGFFSLGTLASKNNNPGNLRFNNQAGAIGQDANGFAIFATVQDGWNALSNLLQWYGRQGFSLAGMMAKYAPAGDGANDPNAYANYLGSQLGISTSTPVAQIAIPDGQPNPTQRAPFPQTSQTAAAPTSPKGHPGSSPPLGSGSSRLAGWFLATISLLCLARAQAQGIRQDTLTLTAPAPAAVTQVSTSVTGMRGGVRYVYWVIANYAGGSAQPAGVIETSAPTALSGSSFVTIQWSAAAGATSYDVLRTSSEFFPSGACTCAVATSVSGVSTTDTGGALSLYIFTPKSPAVGTIRIDNSGATPAFVTSPPLGGGVINATAIANANTVTLTSASGSAYAGSVATCPIALAVGQLYQFIPSPTNSVTNPTLSPCPGLGPLTITHVDGTALLANELDASGTKMCQVLDIGATFLLIPGLCSTGAGFISMGHIAASSVPIPPSGTLTLFYDSANSDHLSVKNSSGSVVDLQDPTLRRRGIPFSIGDPGGSALTAASTTTDYITVPIACSISGYNLLIDAGTITVKFWKVATGTAIPTAGNSISTSGVGISSGTAIHSTTVSDFTTTAVAPNDILAMNVTAVATAKYVSGVLQCDQ